MANKKNPRTTGRSKADSNVTVLPINDRKTGNIKKVINIAITNAMTEKDTLFLLPDYTL